MGNRQMMVSTRTNLVEWTCQYHLLFFFPSGRFCCGGVGGGGSADRRGRNLYMRCRSFVNRDSAKSSAVDHQSRKMIDGKRQPDGIGVECSVPIGVLPSVCPLLLRRPEYQIIY